MMMLLRYKRGKMENLLKLNNIYEKSDKMDIGSFDIIVLMHKKDFQKWHDKKSDVDEKSVRVFFHEREIWFSHLGTNVGFEQDGKGENFGRPVVVFRKFSNEVFWGIPLTTRKKKGKFYFPIDLEDEVHRMAILSQLKLLDSKRLYQKIGVINKDVHEKLEERIVKLCKGE